MREPSLANPILGSTVAPSSAALGPDSTLPGATQAGPPGVDPAAPRWEAAACGFVLLRPVAQGGLGRVSLVRDEALGRAVALKELRPDRSGSPALRERFLAEAAITSQLEHPGIVPIYGMGRDQAGLPFYTMRFIQGRTFAEAIALHRKAPNPLGLRELLGRFVQVCETLGYAHSRGVIHRDLKPANIMLGEYGETLVVDWGLAKALKGEAEPHIAPDLEPIAPSLDQTQAGEIVGTLAYMAPEQAEGDPARVGPAADLYALGAVLYQLLTGVAPLPPCTFMEALDRVKRGAFPPPRQLAPETPPALEAICLKAMALAPTDRYLAAVELAADVRRWLADEPVTARPEPWSERGRRWLRRHRTLTAAAVALLFAAAVSLAVLAFVINGARERLELEQAATAQQKNRALTELGKARAVKNFLVNRVFAAARPKGVDRYRGWSKGLGKDATILQVLDAAEVHAAAAFKSEPTIAADVHKAIGDSYFFLGAFEKAQPHLEEALRLNLAQYGENNIDSLQSLNDLANLRMSQGRREEALALQDRIAAASAGPIDELDDGARRTFRQNRAINLTFLWRFDEAIPELQALIAEEAGVLGPTDIDVLKLRLNLAGVYVSAARDEDAERAFAELLPLLPPDSDDPLRMQAQEALLRFRLRHGRLGEAEPISVAALAAAERVYGVDSPAYAGLLRDRAECFHRTGRSKEAEPLVRQALAQCRKLLGAEHIDTLLCLQLLGGILDTQGRWSEGEPFEREAS